MSQLQDLVKKIFSDEKTRTEFKSNPERILSQYKLSEEERAAVLKTHATFGLVTSNSPQLTAALRASEDWFSPAS
jgi:lipase chaperone LimK